MEGPSPLVGRRSPPTRATFPLRPREDARRRRLERPRSLRRKPDRPRPVACASRRREAAGPPGHGVGAGAVVGAWLRRAGTGPLVDRHEELVSVAGRQGVAAAGREAVRAVRRTSIVMTPCMATTPSWVAMPRPPYAAEVGLPLASAPVIWIVPTSPMLNGSDCAADTGAAATTQAASVPTAIPSVLAILCVRFRIASPVVGRARPSRSTPATGSQPLCNSRRPRPSGDGARDHPPRRPKAPEGLSTGVEPGLGDLCHVRSLGGSQSAESWDLKEWRPARCQPIGQCRHRRRKRGPHHAQACEDCGARSSPATRAAAATEVSPGSAGAAERGPRRVREPWP
jgi:hypothetical protein